MLMILFTFPFAYSSLFYLLSFINNVRSCGCPFYSTAEKEKEPRLSFSVRLQRAQSCCFVAPGTKVFRFSDFVPSSDTKV